MRILFVLKELLELPQSMQPVYPSFVNCFRICCVHDSDYTLIPNVTFVSSIGLEMGANIHDKFVILIIILAYSPTELNTQGHITYDLSCLKTHKLCENKYL